MWKKRKSEPPHSPFTGSPSVFGDDFFLDIDRTTDPKGENEGKNRSPPAAPLTCPEERRKHQEREEKSKKGVEKPVNPSSQSNVDEGDSKKMVCGRYQKGEVLGTGAFSRVYRCLDFRSGSLVAVKSVKKVSLREKELSLIRQELSLMKGFNHPNLIRLLDFEETSGCFNFVLEYIEGGSLHSLKIKHGNFPEPLAVIYIAQTLRGLEYLHSFGVVHRDVKGCNILLTKTGTCKLADFGSCSANIVPGARMTMIGTPYWMAPELISQTGGSTAVDIWSLGCTVLELYTGHPPYFKMNPNVALLKIVQDDLPTLPEDASPNMTNFLHCCFRKRPEERATASKLVCHPWILGGEIMVPDEPANEQPLPSSQISLSQTPPIPQSPFESVALDVSQMAELFDSGSDTRTSTDSFSVPDHSPMFQTQSEGQSADDPFSELFRKPQKSEPSFSSSHVENRRIVSTSSPNLVSPRHSPVPLAPSHSVELPKISTRREKDSFIKRIRKNSLPPKSGSSGTLPGEQLSQPHHPKAPLNSQIQTMQSAKRIHLLSRLMEFDEVKMNEFEPYFECRICGEAKCNKFVWAGVVDECLICGCPPQDHVFIKPSGTSRKSLKKKKEKKGKSRRKLSLFKHSSKGSHLEIDQEELNGKVEKYSQLGECCVCGGEGCRKYLWDLKSDECSICGCPSDRHSACLFLRHENEKEIADAQQQRKSSKPFLSPVPDEFYKGSLAVSLLITLSVSSLRELFDLFLVSQNQNPILLSCLMDFLNFVETAETVLKQEVGETSNQLKGLASTAFSLYYRYLAFGGESLGLAHSIIRPVLHNLKKFQISPNLFDECSSAILRVLSGFFPQFYRQLLTTHPLPSCLRHLDDPTLAQALDSFSSHSFDSTSSDCSSPIRLDLCECCTKELFERSACEQCEKQVCARCSISRKCHFCSGSDQCPFSSRGDKNRSDLAPSPSNHPVNSRKKGCQCCSSHNQASFSCSKCNKRTCGKCNFEDKCHICCGGHRCPLVRKTGIITTSRSFHGFEGDKAMKNGLSSSSSVSLSVCYCCNERKRDSKLKNCLSCKQNMCSLCNVHEKCHICTGTSCPLIRSKTTRQRSPPNTENQTKKLLVLSEMDSDLIQKTF